jgi:hypothetical protein
MTSLEAGAEYYIYALLTDAPLAEATAVSRPRAPSPWPDSNMDVSGRAALRQPTTRRCAIFPRAITSRQKDSRNSAKVSETRGRAKGDAVEANRPMGVPGSAGNVTG